MALFNLAVQWTKVGLHGLFVDLISFYQGLFFPAFDFVRAHASWMLPTWHNNTLVLALALFALNAKSVARHFQLKFESEATTASAAGAGRFSAQVWLGLQVAFAHFAGAYSVGMHGRRITRVTTITIALTCFLALSLVLAIPYVRAVVVAVTAFSALAVIAAVLSRGRLALVEDNSVEWLNKRVFAMHYVGAIVGALVFFLLNRYAA